MDKILFCAFVFIFVLALIWVETMFIMFLYYMMDISVPFKATFIVVAINAIISYLFKLRGKYRIRITNVPRRSTKRN